ncbi:N-acetylmuramoyl-L-alanine amidase [Brevibacillus sp. SYSU BS000544]|uniref:N-acetylmuramoyl-L-alanine amidase n=1 Tax=Brevibacillus sp. SYSU BS000544 TaxID=3416443 RepID=UPI003CE490C4
MQITEILLANKNSRPGTKITPKGLVIHWTANEGKGANATANRNYFNKPSTQASARYIVDDKQIVRCLDETEMGYNVGAKSLVSKCVSTRTVIIKQCSEGGGVSC